MTEVYNPPFATLAGLSAVDMHKQFEPIASMSALSLPVPSLLDSVSAFSATGLTGIDMMSDIHRQVQKMQKDLMEKVRRDATTLFPPSTVLSQLYDWHNYRESLPKKRKD